MAVSPELQGPRSGRRAAQPHWAGLTTSRYFLMRLTCSSLPLLSSFCSMDEMIRQDARRAPITFL